MPTGPLHGALVRDARRSDAGAIAALYNHFVTSSTVTFEEDSVTSDEMSRRIAQVQEGERLPWLVAEVEGAIVGYAYATPWRSRPAYRFSVEVTVYVAPASTRLGIGSTLYAELFPWLERRGIHAAIGGIAQPNEASVALHERFGMRKVAHFTEVGRKFDRWIDVGYWQLTFTEGEK